MKVQQPFKGGRVEVRRGRSEKVGEAQQINLINILKDIITLKALIYLTNIYYYNFLCVKKSLSYDNQLNVYCLYNLDFYKGF